VSPRLRVFVFAFAAALTPALFVASCAKREAASQVNEQRRAGAAPGASGEVDEPLLAWLSMTRSIHHEADMAEDKGDLPGAITTLERVLAKPPPRKAPEADEVLADTRARLGDLRSKQGDFEKASADVTAGLTLVPHVSYYAGHLFEVRGLIEERRAKALAAKGDTAGASNANDLAKKAYEEAIGVQGEVIDRDTSDGGAK
jgi:hypothetical protein